MRVTCDVVEVRETVQDKRGGLGILLYFFARSGILLFLRAS